MTIEDDLAIIRLFKYGVINIDNRQSVSFTEKFMEHMRVTCKNSTELLNRMDKERCDNLQLFLLKTFVGSDLDNEDQIDILVNYIAKLRDGIMDKSEPAKLKQNR